ncbi:MAG TPA: hypothetical protein VLG71_00235 [Candidatus Limnocylindria bacterium]|nr:hypothetical protein [Candidatus Limnocylindria bacterium]
MITKQLLLLTACICTVMTMDAAQKKNLNIRFRPQSAPSSNNTSKKPTQLSAITEESSPGAQPPAKQHITATATKAMSSIRNQQLLHQKPYDDHDLPALMKYENESGQQSSTTASASTNTTSSAASATATQPGSDIENLKKHYPVPPRTEEFMLSDVINLDGIFGKEPVCP